jgi:hypothetical protein
MLKEYYDVPQAEGQPRRRWFGDSFFDLIVWLDEEDQPTGFQLCYATGPDERALTWRTESGFQHTAVDDGEHADRLRKMTPVLVPDGPLDAASLAELFLDASAQIDQAIAHFVHQRVLAAPSLG